MSCIAIPVILLLGFPCAGEVARYTLRLSTNRAVLGQEVTATLRVESASGGAQIRNFQHSGLVLELRRLGSRGEPVLSFPNQQTIQEGGLTVRVQPSGGMGRLAAGGKLERTISLLMNFPMEVLDLGSYLVSYRIEGAGGTVRAAPSRFVIESGAGTVELLFPHLRSTELTIRTRAAGLLHRMTGRGIDYDPRGDAAVREQAAEAWLGWWRRVGSTLIWERAAAGRVIYQTRQLTSTEKGMILKRQMVASPDDRTLWMSDADVVSEFRKILHELGAEAKAGPEPPGVAESILRTISFMPDPSLIPAIAQFITALQGAAGWARPLAMAQALLEMLDSREVPVSVATGEMN